MNCKLYSGITRENREYSAITKGGTYNCNCIQICTLNYASKLNENEIRNKLNAMSMHEVLLPGKEEQFFNYMLHKMTTRDMTTIGLPLSLVL
jgi:hypothetical protein